MLQVFICLRPFILNWLSLSLYSVRKVYRNKKLYIYILGTEGRCLYKEYLILVTVLPRYFIAAEERRQLDLLYQWASNFRQRKEPSVQKAFQRFQHLWKLQDVQLFTTVYILTLIFMLSLAFSRLTKVSSFTRYHTASSIFRKWNSQLQYKYPAGIFKKHIQAYVNKNSEVFVVVRWSLVRASQ